MRSCGVFRVFFALLVHFFILPLSSCAGYHVSTERDYVVASWYGPGFHGNPTSSGELFDMYAYTCAHREYPFGTKLKVTHAENGRSVYCLVNDRGPFVSGRDLDLSYAAAREIGLLEPGVSEVTIEFAGRDPSFIRSVTYAAEAGPLTIQVGSFRERANAQRLKTALALKYSSVHILEVDLTGETYYRVRVGRALSREDAASLGETLAEEGYQVLIMRYDERL